MTEHEDNIEDLDVDDAPIEPARPDGGDEDFSDGSPVKWVVLGLLVLGVGIAAWMWKSAAERAALRTEIHGFYESSVKETAVPARAFRSKIEELASRAAQQDSAPEFLREGFEFTSLHDLEGVYLRVAGPRAKTAAAIEDAALDMSTDAITRCLGVSPMPLRGFYQRQQVLEEGWLEGVDQEDDMLRLRVLDDELRRKTDRDLPTIRQMVAADYLLLLVERGESRREQPVDAYIYDLSEGEPQLLLAKRTLARGALIPVRIRVAGAPPPSARPSVYTGAADDCSIASQIRDAAGIASANFRSHFPDDPPPAAPVAPSEGAEGAAAPTEGAEAAEAPSPTPT